MILMPLEIGAGVVCVSVVVLTFVRWVGRPVQTLYNYVLWDLAFGSNVIITCTHMHQHGVFCLERGIVAAISELLELCKLAPESDLMEFVLVFLRDA